MERARADGAHTFMRPVSSALTNSQFIEVAINSHRSPCLSLARPPPLQKRGPRRNPNIRLQALTGPFSKCFVNISEKEPHLLQNSLSQTFQDGQPSCPRRHRGRFCSASQSNRWDSGLLKRDPGPALLPQLTPTPAPVSNSGPARGD